MIPILIFLSIFILFNLFHREHFRDIFESFLGKEDAYKCAKWAFGEGFENLTSKYLLQRWNTNHPDLFILHGNGNVREDIKKIIHEWKLHGRKNEV